MGTYSATAAAANYVSRGYTGVKGKYTTTRKYSLSDKIVYLDRKWAKFDNILRRELRTIGVSDPEPKVLTKRETLVKFDNHSDGTTTTIDEDTLQISDTEAKFLQSGDVLVANQIFCDSDGANYSTTKFGSGYTPEAMIVSSVTVSGIASGIAKVLVKRGNGACPTSSVQTILTEYKLVKIGNALEDGGDAPTVIGLEPDQEYNYAQLFSKTWGETETEENTDVYGKESMAKKALRKRKDFHREVDGALLFGRRYRDTVNGQSRWFTGGIVEYIPGTDSLDGTTRFIDFSGAFDLETWREKCEIIFRYGGEDKLVFCGGKFFTVLLNNLEKFISVNDTLSKKWGSTVSTLETGHGLMNLVRHPLLSEFDTSGQAWAFDAIAIDLDYVDLMQMNGMDVKVRSNVEDNDEHGRIDEIYGQLGLHRTHPSAHAVIYGITG